MGVDTTTVHHGTDGERDLNRRRAPLFEGAFSPVNQRKYTVIEISEERKSYSRSAYKEEKKDEQTSPLDVNLQNSSNENMGDFENEQALIEELRKREVKFNANDLIFITRDASGQIVWLEKGNVRAGLSHIINRHVTDFKNACGIEEGDIPVFLKKVLSQGKIAEQKSRVVKGHVEYAKKIDYGGKYYILTAIGDNGFIVSAFPQK